MSGDTNCGGARGVENTKEVCQYPKPTVPWCPFAAACPNRTHAPRRGSEEVDKGRWRGWVGMKARAMEARAANAEMHTEAEEEKEQTDETGQWADG